MSKNNAPSCNVDPSRHPRQMYAPDQCRQPINTPKECLRNMNPGKRPIYSFPSQNSSSPSAIKGRQLNVAMEVERDKCIAKRHNRVPVDINRDRYRSNSAEGRTFDRDLDFTYNRAPNALSHTPPQLQGRRINIEMEVERERERRLAMGQRKLSPPAKNGSKDYTQYSHRLSDSAPTNITNNFGTPSVRMERLLSRNSAATNFQTPRTGNLPVPKSAGWHSRPIHSSPIRQKPDVSLNASYPATGGNTITRTTVTTTTTRSIPPQNSRYFPDNSILAQREQPNKSLDVDIVRQQNQMPNREIAPESLLRTPQKPLSNSSLTSHATGYPRNDSQNTIQCPIEFEDTQHSPAATDTSYDKPAAESTRYEDTDDQKYSRGVTDISQRAPGQMYNAVMTPQSQSEWGSMDQSLQPQQRLQCPQSTFIDPTGDKTIGSLEAEEPYTVENLPPQKYSFHKSKLPIGSPSDLGYGTYESCIQSPRTGLNASTVGSQDGPRNTFSLAYEAGPTDPQPKAVCPPCPQESPITALFRCLANRFSSTFDYLSSFVTSQKSLDASTAKGETFPYYRTSRQPGTWEPLGRTSYPMTQTQPQCIYDTMDNDNRTRLPPAQCNQGYDSSSRNPLSSGRRHDVPQSVRECAEAKRCGRVMFDASDKYEVQNIQLTQMRRTQMENLVLDTYCPGIIQETIDGREDFNTTSRNIFDQLNADNCNPSPSQEPMTLLEAFALRIDKERSDLNQKLQEDATEIIINETVNVHFASEYPSDLNRSIKSLLLSERMAECNQMEAAKTSSFDADVERKVTNLELFDVPFKFVAYVGQTKPSE